MAVLTASNQNELEDAVRALRDGDTLKLAPGTYDKLAMYASLPVHSHVTFAQKVTITSADPDRPAVINEVILRGATNVELKGVKLDYAPAKTDSDPFMIENARGITLNDVTFQGHVANGFGAGIALRVKNSEDVEIRDSLVSDFRNGLTFANSADVAVTGTDFRGMSNDAMLLTGMTGVRIENNDFRDMHSSASVKHKDMIQFYDGADAPPSRDVVIRGNVIDNPEVSHAIFFGNELAAAGDLGARHRNILIEDNWIRSAQVHGVTVEHADGVTIRDNTILRNTALGHDDGVNIPLINVSTRSTDVTITGNAVASVPWPQNATWAVWGNTTTTTSLPHWYGDYGPVRDADSDPGPSAEDFAEAPVVTGVPGTPAEDIEFRVNGRRIDGVTRYLIEDIDFSDSDKLVFNMFEADTFKAQSGGNGIAFWNDGQSIKMNSAVDLQELVQASAAVSAVTLGTDDLLILTVEQDDGRLELAIEGMGAAFRAADHPELF